ncbi:probable membrane-associated kinase regulator 1 [Vicia villosa]|uniref:probable membrane-associated kinase regulator 1 n=1 Tax=Vicia villosa TaxID=3911 RepID=UPI00273AA0E5|nr:probable membrane-associated kinase regulator 1 [Vicia villosa]
MYDVVSHKTNKMAKRKTTTTNNNNHRTKESKSHTLPSSPSHSFSSSSSSDFEFTISISPRKSSNNLCPADELFYKGQLLPLHLSPRISMVRTLLLSSSSTSSATSSSTAPRDSTGSTNSNDSTSSFISDLALFPDSCDSSRPSSVTEDDELKRLHHINNNNNRSSSQLKKPNKYFSLSRFSSVFRRETVVKTRERVTVTETETAASNIINNSNSSVKRMSVTAKEVIRKYFKKVKPLYEKLSQKQQPTEELTTTTTNTNTALTVMSLLTKTERSEKDMKKDNVSMLSHSFSGNLRYPRKRNFVSSCPSSMRSSPSHSGVLSSKGVVLRDSSSMEELQSAIQGAITHCKNSLITNH